MKPQSETKKRKEREACSSPKSPVKKSKLLTDAPSSSTQGRETMSSKISNTGCNSGKLSIKSFSSTTAKSFFSDVVKKSIIPQRNLDVPDFSKKTNLLPILHSKKLFKYVIPAGSYVKKVVQEFFYNLFESCVTDDVPSYHKVFVRGKLYDFSPSVINNFLGTTPNPAISPFAEETVWNELTNGLRDYQHGKSKVPSSVLKSLYALLLKTAAFHWLPTTHTNIVPLCMANLIYKIKNNAPFDLVAGASSTPTQNPTSVNYQLSFLDNEIKALQMDADYHNEIAQKATERRIMLIHIANNLIQTRGARRQGESLTKQRTVADTEENSQEDSEKEFQSSLAASEEDTQESARK
ncbi:unnamed protein product [Cuscuta campestris]|uniref:Putative plant transposon protein domain-containing protein n=1 Tax=Cuscuta campestris TaxID=132261 RepID=A0A484MP99_9ASTE|nr:unnamed protein product [Cuscuta campestris]